MIVQSDGTGFFPIPDSTWAAPGTSFAVVSGDTLPAFNSARGAVVGLRVEPPPASGVPVELVFDTLSIVRPNSFELRLEPLARLPVDIGSRYSASPSGEGLYISGVKRLGVSLGSGGGLVQGTRLSLDGTLAPGVSVRGAITDESLPLGTASSEAVSELDRVNLLVEGSSWTTELGDMEREMTGDGLTPLRYRRSLSGFAGSVTPAGGVTGGAGYGVAGARRYHTVFLTQEGVQGPYSFAPSGVTPGSERIYLDGVLLSRGSSADYTVDYPGGRLTFTASRLIRRDQRVEATCYREGDGFRRGIMTGGLSIGSGELGLESGFFREGDDTGSPLGFVMSPEAEEVLRNAGENPADAWLSGATYLGEGEGSYGIDSLGHYVYLGPGGGGWEVTFQRPPEGPGDYVYDSVTGGYRWVEEGGGTHLPRKYIDIPAMRELGGVALHGGYGVLSADLSGFVSRREGNLFNPAGTTREGSFLSTGLVLEPWPEGPALFARGRLVSGGFSFPDESDADIDLSRWLLPVGFKGNDSYAEAGLSSERASFSAGKRFLSDGGSVEMVQSDAHFVWDRLAMGLNGKAGRRGGAPGLPDGDLVSAGTSLSLSAGEFTPFLSLSTSRESWADSLSGWLNEGEAGTLLERGDWNFRVFAGGALDRRNGSGLPDRTARAGVSGSGRGVSWSMDGTYNHSTSWFPEGGLSRADAITMGLSLNGPGWWSHTDYSAGGYLGRSVEIVYTWVGEGNGEYSYDPETGEYYPDPGGAYDRSFQSGEGEEKVLECGLKSSGYFRGEGAGLDGSLILQASDPYDRLKTFTLAGALDSESPGEWSVSLSPWLSWEEGLLRRVTLRLSASDLRETLSGSGRRRATERSVRLTPLLRLHRVIELELSGRVNRRDDDLYGPRSISGLLISADPRYLPAPGISAGLELSADRRSESSSLLSETSYGVRPHISVNTGGWTTSASYAVSVIPGEGDLPSWFFDGVNRGVTHDGSVNAGRNLGRWIRLSLFFRGRRPAGGDWTRTGGLEGTVSF